ncbi:MAG: hypothetical protein CM15mP103_00150 [Gammaproteobacteria bacterium]|nr:MAG: hypothetical protein CM15mP103_00150 [Gammaproteobacteria bacterium]
MFIIHGEQDPRAPVEHALVMMEAMDAAGKPYEKLLFEKEGHGLTTQRLGLQCTRRLSPFEQAP